MGDLCCLVRDVAAGVLEHFAEVVVEVVGGGEGFEADVATVTPIVVPFGGHVDALVGGFFGAEFFVESEKILNREHSHIAGE